jgi:hypothetical protein
VIRNYIRNRRIIGGGVSFEKAEMKQQECLGIHSGVERRGCRETITMNTALEDWILVGLKLGHPLPVIAKINLNNDLAYEPVEAL